MPRQSRPFLRKQTKSWYCSIGGRQISLGKNREAAFEKFHSLMADRDQLAGEMTTLDELTQCYLDWCQANRKPGTYKLHRHYLKTFIGHVGRRLRPGQLRVHHVTRWLETLTTINSTSQNDAIQKVQRMLNWSVEQGYLNRNPIAGMAKPRRKRRDVFYTPEQWEQIREHARPPFDDFLDFLYCTGCRPKEARTIEARFILNDMVIFPTDESKGEIEPRVIYLVPKAKTILDRLAAKHPSGPVFINSRGNPWTKDSIKCRLDRISGKVGFRCIAYGARHSWATNALTSGGVDPISAAHLMGHRDPTMVARVYSHIAKNPDFLRKQALNAVSPTA
ncbi:tyrosine-type recombinase/integrase [Crateriforma conspicua]|uniref:tyrosine-type recombinase/integrase n=1 Tax=Crateriforma conspicua TaxID=2527996 RepID=UPI00118B342B|nr:tyrosine-type recombinase/integrase [Crateriforma conspicua]QDV61959.1 site-specific tyrosine recombinase XerC [Crateriforma conspicua]